MLRSGSAWVSLVPSLDFQTQRPSPRVRSAARAAAGAMLEVLERREFLSAGPSASIAGASPAATVSVAALLPTTTRVDSSAQWTVYGQGVTLTAFVTGGGTGPVSFYDGGAVLGTAPLAPNGQAKFFTAALAVGNHTITATYGGDATHEPSTSGPAAQSVSAALTTTSLGSSAGVIANPILRPDRVVVVIEENGASNAIGDTANMPYFNQLAASGLVYNNSHGLNGSEQVFGQMNYLALYSGSTQGITDDFSGYSFDSPNIAKSLHDAGLSFSGFVESLPAAGDMTTHFAGDPSDPLHPDAYARRYNPMAQFTDVGAGRTNADVNKPFSSFPTDYSALPTVSYVVPNRLHNTHGSNEAPPFANDPSAYTQLRRDADQWLQQNLDGYLQWAKTHNSLLIIQTEDADRTRNYAGGGTTIVAGDPRLFVSGVNGSYVSHYGVLRTIEDMYGIAPIGATATASRFDTDPLGRLSPAGPVASTLIAGQPVTYTASVSPIAPAAGIPGGAVQFLMDGSAFGGPITLSNGSASISINGLNGGSHTISAVYTGDGSFTGSTSSLLAQPVDRVGSSLSLASNIPSSRAGQTVTFTATVGQAPGAGVPTGSVTFRDGATTLGSVPLDASGRAAFSTATLATGTHSISAVYTGDTNYSGATAALDQIVSLSASSVGLATSAATARVGEGVTFTATVSAPAGAFSPTGTVTFRDGATVLGTAPLNASGQATLTANSLAVGLHSITASYSGDANFTPGTSATLSQTIQSALSSTTVVSSGSPANVGQNVVFTATVTGSAGALKPTGTVVFFDGATRLGSGVVDAAGKASFATAALAAGTHSITAAYSGDANFASSVSAAISQQIVPVSTRPANDNFANRITLTGRSLTTTGTNTGATKETNEPKHAGNVGGKSVWWSWTAPASGYVTLDTAGSNFRTLIGVYTGTGLTSLRKVDGIRLTLRGAMTFTFRAQAGKTYQIAVDGFNGASGNLNLRLTSWTGRPSSGGGDDDGRDDREDRDDIRPPDDKQKKAKKKKH